MWIFLTVSTAAVAGYLLMKMKVPGGMLVGAILGAAMVNILTQRAYIYPEARIIAQTLTGTYIGCMVTREDVRHLPYLLRPYLTVMVSLLILNLCMGTLIYHLTSFDLLTCLFCAAPGGISDTPLIAMEMGADSSVVAVMQFVRMLFGMGCLPSIIMLSDRIIEPNLNKDVDAQNVRSYQTQAGKPQATLREFLPTFCVAFVAGILGKISGLPAGILSFALIVAAGMKISGKCSGMPSWLRRLAQVISGCCIGSSITRGQILQMRQLVIPAAALCLGYIICCIGVGWLVSRMFHMDLKEAMLTLSPAGATEMALIAADLGVESPNLVVLQICRLVGVMLFFPHIFNLILSFL